MVVHVEPAHPRGCTGATDLDGVPVGRLLPLEGQVARGDFRREALRRHHRPPVEGDDLRALFHATRPELLHHQRRHLGRGRRILRMRGVGLDLHHEARGWRTVTQEERDHLVEGGEVCPINRYLLRVALRIVGAGTQAPQVVATQRTAGQVLEQRPRVGDAVGAAAIAREVRVQGVVVVHHEHTVGGAVHVELDAVHSHRAGAGKGGEGVFGGQPGGAAMADDLDGGRGRGLRIGRARHVRRDTQHEAECGEDQMTTCHGRWKAWHDGRAVSCRPLPSSCVRTRSCCG